MSNFKAGDIVLCKCSNGWCNSKTGKPSEEPNPVNGQEYTVTDLDTSDGDLGLYLLGFERSYSHTAFTKKVPDLSMEFVKVEKIIEKNKNLILKN